ncbi:MAG: hypothetical protein R3C32_11520 [Chloroflexota bacterium]
MGRVLLALEQVRAAHGGHTVYDARDVFLRSRMFDHMPGWQRAILTRYETAGPRPRTRSSRSRPSTPR